MSKLGEQLVDEETRDKLFAQIKSQSNNNVCLDCEKKNPKWASIHLGIHLCYDCAGKHRQYGVIYSFVKSINLDAWNQKQLLFMEKGGNARALQYFKKRGAINLDKHIDYKSPIVQQYKTLLTEEVEMELGGVKVKAPEEKKPTIQSQTGPIEEKKIEIATAEQVKQQSEKPKKKKDKKKIGAKQIEIEDFEERLFDNGVPTEEKDKIVKEYEKKKDIFDVEIVESEGKMESLTETQAPKVEEPKQLSIEEANKKIEELKQKANVKTLSSNDFKDTSMDNPTLKQNLNKFQGATSISSSAFFNKPEEEVGSSQIMDNIKDFVSNAGEKWFKKFPGLTGYFNK